VNSVCYLNSGHYKNKFDRVFLRGVHYLRSGQEYFDKFVGHTNKRVGWQKLISFINTHKKLKIDNTNLCLENSSSK
jgi:hypothetical protein